MKNVTTLNDQIIKSVEELDEERVIKLANKALKSGMDPLFLLNLINEGVKRVGKLYEERKYFIADLI
ncbi:MAG: B12-binding domain-containing protein, partial [Bacillota bacterium]